MTRSGRKARSLWRRTGVAFWFAIFAVAWKVGDEAASSLLPVRLGLIAAGFIGAFLGASPLVLLPVTARFAFGPHASIGHPERRSGQLFLLAAALFTTGVAVLRIWPHEGWTGRVISESGILAAILAGAFLSQFREAARLWIGARIGRHRSGGDVATRARATRTRPSE